MADVREEVQNQAKTAWLNSSRKNSIIASVGSGKSKIALDIIKETNPSAILLLTNAVTLRDVNWKNEFEKFGMLEYWDRVKSMTYQAAYNFTHHPLAGEWPLMILDEIDFACTPEYSKCFDIPAKAVLGLTGFITEDKRGFLQLYFPICYEITTEEMQADNLLNQSQFIFIEFPLSKAKLLEQKTKTGTIFRVSENDQYVYWDKKFQQAMIIKQGMDKRMSLDPNTVDAKAYTAADWNMKLTATKRRNLLQGLDSSIQVTKEVLAKIHSRPGNKALVFSASTKQADKLPNPYHSKQEVANLDDLNEGRVNTMSVVKKITRGVNLIGVNYLIRESYDGSEETFAQSHGRLLRLEPGQVAKYIILIPKYEALTRQPNGSFKMTSLYTQAYNWADKMTRSFNIKNVLHIEVGPDYKLKEGITL